MYNLCDAGLLSYSTTQLKFMSTYSDHQKLVKEIFILPVKAARNYLIYYNHCHSQEQHTHRSQQQLLLPLKT